MSKEDKDEFSSYVSYHDIADFGDFSITEVIALEFLARYSDPIIRHTLYTELSQFIQFKEDITPQIKIKEDNPFQKKFYEFVESSKKLSPSSFYNSLNKLEEIGVLSAERNQKNKITFIKPTQYTRFIPKLLLRFLINNDLMDSAENKLKFSKKFIEEKILERIGDFKNLKNILTVWFTEFVGYALINEFAPIVDDIFIIYKSEHIQSGSNSKINNIQYSRVINKRIREPDEIFDGVLVPIHKKKPKFYKMSGSEIIDELKRVTKPEGLIILVGMADIPLTNNPFADELINLYKISLNDRIFTEEELRDDMASAGIKKIEITEHEGLLIGIGQK